ncbi:MAG: HPr(Ser) kinase/phosphatase [Blastochloris sp.]|nr:HPr(Ser) kinase/phosphatase [Blastochloris sp.]
MALPPKRPEHPKVTVGQFYARHSGTVQLKLVAGAEGMNRRITEGSVNRLGLALTGFYKYFAYRRIQLIGKSEMAFIRDMKPEACRKRFQEIFNRKVPCLIFARNIRPPAFIVEEAERHGIPVFISPVTTMRLVNTVTICLEDDFAPFISLHSSMVDIQGVGVLIMGESGIGKSECVLGLIERGYSLVSDDITRIKCLEGRDLVGTSADLTRHYIEVRGIGVINVASIFGASSIRYKKSINLVVTLKEWAKLENVDRTGLDQEHYEILQIKLPHVTIPVRSGRDLAGLVEVAALDQKLKNIGHHSAHEFNERLLKKMQSGESEQ